jgi:hypothetical protein
MVSFGGSMKGFLQNTAAELEVQGFHEHEGFPFELLLSAPPLHIFD